MQKIKTKEQFQKDRLTGRRNTVAITRDSVKVNQGSKIGCNSGPYDTLNSCKKV